MATHVVPSVGARFKLHDSIGTIRYAGRSMILPEYGLEWNGTIRSASANINYGNSFLSALYAKYVELPRAASSQLEKVLLGSSNGAIEVEAVDLDKIREKFSHLDRLREISLDNELVARLDEDPETIRTTCPSVRGLDLSQSLIPEWNVIASICTGMPSLQRLALNRNRLSIWTDILSADCAFLNLIELRLNGTLTTWQEMQQLVRCMPVLKAVELGYNLISDVSNAEGHPALETVNLDSNQLKQWTQICDTLSAYPSLDRLVLTTNRIEEIPLPAQRRLAIRHLSLSYNLLSSWRNIDALPLWCPALESLTLAGNPLFNEPGPAQLGVRHFVIARISSLVTLDAAHISPQERTDCELMYLSHIARSTSDADRTRLHPRWDELCQKHGRPEEPDVGQKQDKLSKRLVDPELELFKGSPDDPPDASATVKLRALPSMSLGALRSKILKTLKHSPNHTRITLWLRMDHNSFTLLESDRDSQDLAWLGIENGSVLRFVIES
ncbi:unnamed protein product [Mycena citricolor]|uniref:Tubulin-specific chaperone E n=1 Tax=Mycena citricolor TaxID=2018698 RepID=A0AAD2JX82_9AGAR|nr:unnamed protein product [Mycena citricolor]